MMRSRCKQSFRETSKQQTRILAGLLVLASLRGVLASEGDVQLDYWTCVQFCAETGTVQVPGAGPPTAALACKAGQVPIALRLFRWTCTADCRYHCMWAVEVRNAHSSPHLMTPSEELLLTTLTTQRPRDRSTPAGHISATGAIARGARTLKYHGKWPFRRRLGMQEPMSVLFSLLNLLAHVAGLTYLLHILHSQPKPYPWALTWVTYTALHMNAWACSAVFHARDTHLTERLDYCAADLEVFWSLYATLARVAWPGRERVLQAARVLIPLALLALLHYMLAVKFDYGLNVRVCIALGLCQTCAWVWWGLCTEPPPAHRTYLFTFLVLVHGAMLLEVLDFPPLWHASLDAHALWHLCTVPLTLMFYHFLALDCRHWYSVFGAK